MKLPAGSEVNMEPEKVLVSVIIPVKNGLPKFSLVIERLKTQKLRGEFEVIIIDSGSSDGSTAAIPTDDQRFRKIFIEPANFGHGKTRNLGAKEARGKFCAFLTHDAVPMDDFWLAELIKPLQEDDQVAGVFGKHVAYEDATPFTKWGLQKHFENLSNWPIVVIDDARAYVRNRGLRQVYHFYSDNSSCLRKSVWKQYPYPDVYFAEDQIWAKTIIEAGYKKAFAASSVVYHSHDYGVMETLRRSYDESKALNTLFGYKMCGSFWGVILQSLRTTLRDMKLSFANGWIISNPKATLTQPLLNIARQVGYYMGSVNSEFVDKRALVFSRDNRLKAN